MQPIDTPMDLGDKLIPNQGETYSNTRRYIRLVGKLDYLNVTYPNITFTVGVVSQFLNTCQEHWMQSC